MKLFGAVLIALAVTGCATSGPGSKSSWEWLMDPPCPGTRYYDPQVCKGQSFGGPLPNQPFEAQVRRARGEQW